MGEDLYQSGKYPSVVDTDDMVFEMGLQVVNRLNNEKLIKQALGQIEAQKQYAAKQIEECNRAISLKLEAENRLVVGDKRVSEFEQSNRLYEKSNRELGDEIAKLRNQIQVNESEYKEREDNLKIQIEALQNKIVELSTVKIPEKSYIEPEKVYPVQRKRKQADDS